MRPLPHHLAGVSPRSRQHKAHLFKDTLPLMRSQPPPCSGALIFLAQVFSSHLSPGHLGVGHLGAGQAPTDRQC